MLNQKGFSMIEMIAVLIIMGILAAFIIPRFISFDDNATAQMLSSAVDDLNQREKMAWSNQKIGSKSYSDEELDSLIQLRVELDLGDRIQWNGNTLILGSVHVSLERLPATNVKPAVWGGTDLKGRKYGWHKN